MFFNDLIQRRFVSLIRPWLSDEPELEVKIGFLRSRGTIKNLNLNASALNQSLDDSTRFLFKEVTVQQLSLCVSYWSSTTFVLRAQGLRVVLLIREEEQEEGGSLRPRKKPRDTSLEDKRRILAEIDSEGTVLHDAIKRISNVTSGSWKINLLTSVLGHCQLEVDDIHVLVLLPRSNNSFSCSLKLKELIAKSHYIGQTCSLRRFMGSFLLPSRKCSFDVDVKKFEVGLRNKSYSSSVVSTTDISSSVTLENLRCINFVLRLTLLRLSFSPSDLAIISHFCFLLSIEPKYTRTGIQLWRIAASRISSLISTPKFSLYRVSVFVDVWLRYLQSYEHMLSLIGYPVCDIINKSAAMMFSDRTYSNSVKRCWHEISELEYKLSPDAIALARQVIRYRVSGSAQLVKNHSDWSYIRRLLWEVYQMLVRILTIIYHVLNFITQLVFLKKAHRLEANRQQNDQCCKVTSDNFFPNCHICLNVGKLKISVTADKRVIHPVSDEQQSANKFCSEDLIAFHLSADAFFLKFFDNLTEDGFMFSCGCIKVVSSSLLEDSLDNVGNLRGDHEEKEVLGSQAILMLEPARVYTGENLANDIGSTSVPSLELILGRMWLNWKNVCSKFLGNNCDPLQNPCILLESRHFLTDPSSKNIASEFYKGGMVMGRLNLTLEYSSVVSLAIIFGQIQHALYWDDRRMQKNVGLHTSRTLEGQPEIDFISQYKPLASRIGETVVRMCPEKHMEIGVVVAGSKIQLLSLRKEKSLCGKRIVYPVTEDDLLLSVNIDDIELLVSPNSGSDSILSCEHIEICDDQSLGFSLKETQNGISLGSIIDITSCKRQFSLEGYLKVYGLKVCLSKSSHNSSYQVFMLRPVTAQLTSLRKDCHSLGSRIVAVSTDLRCLASGFTALVFLDDMFVLMEVVSSLKIALLHAFSCFSSNGGSSCPESFKEQMPYVYSESEEMIRNREKAASPDCVVKHFAFRSKCELGFMDLVLYNSWKCNNGDDYTRSTDASSKVSLDIGHMFDRGIHLSVRQASAAFSYEGGIIELLIDLTGVKSSIIKYSLQIVERLDEFDPGSLFSSLNCLCEASCSYFKLHLHLNTSGKTLPVECSCSRNEGHASTSSTNSGMFKDSLTLRFMNHSCHWLCSKLFISEVYLTEGSIKNILVAKHQSNKLEASLSAAGQFEAICCQSKGGSVYLETTALLLFVQCIIFYRQQINDILSALSLPEKRIIARDIETMVSSDYETEHDIQQLQHHNWDHLKTLSISLSQLSLSLVAKDEIGRLQELLIEADVCLNLEVQNMQRKLFFEISKFSIFSEYLHETSEQAIKEILIPHFSMTTHNDSSSTAAHEDCSVSIEHQDFIEHVIDDSSSKSDSFPQNELYSDKTMDSFSSGVGAEILNSTPQNYLLKEFSAFMVVECPDPMQSDHFWVGNGSVSDFDMTISLTEIQTIIFAVESLSGVLVQHRINNIAQSHLSIDQESEGSFMEKLPDGTIVAIEDVFQHMYIAVENSESRNNLVGTMHYSLVGERSLFKVKHHNQGRWRPRTRYFSLISLYAKDESGHPLRLNSRPRSDFVDISGSNDSAWAFWTAFPYRPGVHDDDPELEKYYLPAKNTFYLVNKKNDRALAFIDGILEFVAKPGNPFKFKVFQDFPPFGNGLFSDCYSGVALERGLPCNSRVTDERDLGNIERAPGVSILINKVAVTIVHELADTTERFLLLQGTVDCSEVIVQMSNTKSRFMCRLAVMLRYFDARRNIWRELVHPLDICIFYRYRFLTQGSEYDFPGVRAHLHARIKELGISLTELSLDILLFVIGKLKLAGPFAVRNSAIFANCCKVENQSGLTLHCQFFDNQYASVAGQQSTTILLRHLALANQPPQASVFSLRLTDQGVLSTSSLHLSLLEARVFAWRTRVISSQESKTSPGPFIVVEVSQRTEEGLSIVVSPLLRIYNETDFSMELRFQRPQQKETDFASLVLQPGDSVDDSIATFGATNLSGGSKKALISLSVGNFLFSFRPRIADKLQNFKISSVEWSDDLKGGKPVRLSSLFEKLSYQVRTTFSVESWKCAFGTAHCSLKLEGGRIGNIYFLIQSAAKDVPVTHPDNFGYAFLNKNPPIALQEQKEIFLLPTVCVSNLLQTEIHVNLTDADPQVNLEFDNICSQATIPCGAAVNLYANPATIFFMVSLTAFDSSCKPINSSEWIKKLQKQKSNAHHLDIELDFGGGKYFAFLRLSRGHRGTLEARIFTSYALHNDTSSSMFCFGDNLKPLSRVEAEKLGSRIPPELGVYLPPKSTRSWFMKRHKVCVKLVEEKASEALLDLDALSGLTEIDLEVEEKPGATKIIKFGVSLKPASNKSDPSNIVYVNPRHVILNQSGEVINIRQCYLEDDMERIVTLSSKQRTALKLQKLTRKKREMTIFEKLVRKHINSVDDPHLYVQFRPKDFNFGWSGPVCVASLGQFFLKFRRLEHTGKSDSKTSQDPKLCEFSAVHVVEEDSALVLHFYKPPNIDLPYRIENCLPDAPITYYQKGSLEPDTLGSGCIVSYVWDDLTLPHKLLVQINDIHVLREINLDKVRAWKPFYKTNQQRGLGFLLLDKKQGDVDSITGMGKLGYEIFAEGLTRVLRICEFSDSHKRDPFFYSTSKMRFGTSNFSLQLLEYTKQENELGEASVYTSIISIRLENIDMLSIFTYQHRVNQLNIQSMAVDQRWIGAPFSSVLRRNQSDYFDPDDKTLRIVLISLSSGSTVYQIKYLSIILQALDLNLDEETLMRIVPFWRTSLSDPNTPSQLYYFDHFAIHPIKIVASFLPRESYASYSSTQETLRSLLHSVVKIPAIKNMSVELNGVLVTHALITLRQLSIKCAQHYSWYALRAIYIAKGSPLLPPAFASIFDDFASSSLDAFFDPSSGMLNFPGLTMGTFKLISKCIDGKGFSGTKRYFGDLGKTLKMAGSNIIFATITEISDSVLKGAETNGFNGMVHGFHQGILKIAMEPSFLGSAVMEGGPNRKIKLDRSPGVDELYIEGYLQALLDTIYKQEYLRVRVVDNQVILKNLPPNSSLIDEIMERVKGFLVSKALLKGDSSSTSQSLRHIRGESEWRIGPTVLTLCEHLFVSFTISILRREAGKVMNKVKLKKIPESSGEKALVPTSTGEERKVSWRWGIGKFVFSGIVAYVDGRLCRCIPNPIARRVVSGFLLSYLENDKE